MSDMPTEIWVGGTKQPIDIIGIPKNIKAPVSYIKRTISKEEARAALYVIDRFCEQHNPYDPLDQNLLKQAETIRKLLEAHAGKEILSINNGEEP